MTEPKDRRSLVECSRCGSVEGVHLRTWCAECGPTHTCNECDQWHQDDLAESEATDD